MTDVGLGFALLKDETYRQAVERIAGKWELQQECLDDFDEAIAAGYAEENAAWSALYNWDVLGLYVDGKEK